MGWLDTNFGLLITATEDVTVREQSNVCPNPTSGMIHFDLSSHTVLPGRIELYDLTARLYLMKDTRARLNGKYITC